MVAAAIRTIFAQQDAEHVRDQLEVIATMLGWQFPKVETMLREAADDVAAFADFTVAHWKKTWSTNPFGTGQQGDQTPHRRVDALPKAQTLLRLAGCVRIEVHDEWQFAKRLYVSEGSMALINAKSAEQEVVAPELVAS